MIILGIKIIHDGTLELIDKGQLIFFIRNGEINDNERHAPFNMDNDEIEEILQSYGYSLEVVDQIAIDGWYNESNEFHGAS